MIRKILKYLAYLFLGILILILLLSIFTQTVWFRNIIKTKIEKIADKNINRELTIGDIKGNLYESIRFSDVTLNLDNRTIASFSDLQLNYSFLSLFKTQILIDSLILENPFIHIEQQADSTWNFNKLYIDTKIKKNNRTAPFLFSINLNHGEIRNGNFSSSTFFHFIPDSVIGFDLLISGSYASEKIGIQLDNLNFKTKNPDISIDKISTGFQKNDNKTFINDLLIKTDRSLITINAELHANDDLFVDINTNPINKDEIAAFLPSLKMVCSPVISANFKSIGDTTLAEIEIVNNDETIDLNAVIQSLYKVMIGDNLHAPYNANLNIKNVLPENWIEMPETNAILNGTLTLNGSNLFDPKFDVNIDADLSNSSYYKNIFKTLYLRGNYGDNKINGSFDIETNEGRAWGDALINELVSGNPKYQVAFKSENLDLTSLVPQLKGTLINAGFHVKGSGATLDNLILDSEIQINNSSIYQVAVDSAELKARIIKDVIFLDTLTAFVPGATMRGNANYSIETKEINSGIDVVSDSLNFLAPFIQFPIIFDTLDTHTTVKGKLNELNFTGNLGVSNIEGFDVKTESLTASYSGVLIQDSVQVDANINAINTITGSIIWDSLTASVNYFKDHISAIINANWKDTLNAKLHTIVNTGDSLIVQIPVFELKSDFSELYFPDSLQSVKIHNNSIAINNLYIKDKLQPEFNLSVNGNLAMSESDNIHLSIKNLNLAPYNKYFQLKDSVIGIIASDFVASGSLEDPEVQGNIFIDNPGYGNIKFSEFSSNLSYSDKSGKIDFLLPDLGSSGSVWLPIDISRDTTGFNFNLPETFDAEFKIDSLLISQPINNQFSDIDVSGNLSIDLKANGNLKNPLIYGNASIKNGQLIYPQYGLNYNDITAHVKLDGKNISIDTLQIKQNKGSFFASGNVDFDSTIINGNITNSSLKLNAKNFEIINNKDLNLIIDAATTVEMENNNPTFGGRIDIVRSDIFLPALMSSQFEQTDETQTESLLVQALNLPGDTSNVNNSAKVKIDEPEKSINYLNNLTGRINLEIPRNTWIRSDNLNMELRGDIELIKTKEYFELYGEINVVRGYYILYGRRLKIEEGSIIFQGGEKLDPVLNIKANYTYRDAEKVKRQLELSISGLLSDPEITFAIDGAEAEEIDAVSILIFGRTSDEMSLNNQNGIVGAVGSNMIAQVLTSQLNKTLGSRFNLDIIEINATENWQSAALVVGKYITNDLFLTYQRGFGESEDDKITPETISLEYELNQLLFLRLQSGNSKTSGLDVILKFEAKEKE